MAPPPSISWLEPLIHEGIHNASIAKKNGSIRLNWSRGDDMNRGINLIMKNELSTLLNGELLGS